jgi:hypothetical protein
MNTRPEKHDVNQGGVQRTTPQVTLYKSTFCGQSSSTLLHHHQAFTSTHGDVYHCVGLFDLKDGTIQVTH